MTTTLERPASPTYDEKCAHSSNHRASFENVCMPHMDALYRFGMGLTGDEMHADDLVQDTMLKAFRGWRKFRAGTNARAWLLTILRNTFYTQYRATQRRGIVVDLDVIEPYVPSDQFSDFDADTRFFDGVMDVEIEAAIQRLPNRFREAFLLNVEGLDYRRIAEVLGIPIGTVRSRIHRARHSLRRELFDYGVRGGLIRPRRCAAVAS